MPRINDILHKASTLWTYLSPELTGDQVDLQEGEIIYSKNNVCVHPNVSQEGCPEDGHVPGYFTLRAHRCQTSSQEEEPTLVLTWIPNKVIRTNPNSVATTACSSPSRCRWGGGRTPAPSPSPGTQRTRSMKHSRRHSSQSLCSGDNLVNPEAIAAALNSMVIKENFEKETQQNGSSHSCGRSTPEAHVDLGSPSPSSYPRDNGSYDDNLSLSTSGTKGLISSLLFHLGSRSPSTRPPSGRLTPITPACTPTRLYAISSGNGSPRGVFSVDLRQMKSLRLFFSSYQKENGEEPSNGQLVIASRESQFKVFHFHFGGLDKLVSVLEEWRFLRKNNKDKKVESLNCHQFYVYSKLQLKDDECHPEEGIYNELDEATLRGELMNSSGQIEDELSLRRIVFFSGIHASVRREVWPLLLQRFRFNSTFDERQKLKRKQQLEYNEINKKRRDMTEDEKVTFWKAVQCTVEKDVPRTDRTNPFFAGDGNLNIEIMKRILLNYAVYNPSVGYTQGMSDLLSPLMVEMENECESFWSFVGLMEKTFFVSTPRDVDMDMNLNILRELIRVMFPEFFGYLKNLPDALELLFAHRWMLLCFKREFPENCSLKLWEACWSRYQTDYFHLFLCLAIITIYGQETVDHEMKADEILFHFSTLTMHMNGDVVLRKARGLLYQFRLLTRIPCTLAKLCEHLGPGIWDSRYSPAIECVRDLGSDHIYIPCNCFG